jgi:perosamine synthetase
MIFTGGIDVSGNEAKYVNDALANGWNENHNSYIKRFESAFAEYCGVRYARTTSGGTQALTLALAALDVGAGDEVILPDLTYFACSDVIKLLGATPVFVDIDPISWCIDTKQVEFKITEKTKAIMPVWLYGNAPNMHTLLRLSYKYKIPIVEDACPAVGSMFAGSKAGSFGTFGCFSFHGSKIMTTGFGGMIVTDDEYLYNKVLWLNDHCEDRNSNYRFWQTGIGYSFDMSNISAAFGLAQLERVDDFVAKKRQIYQWYEDRLADKFLMNQDAYLATSNMWLTSILVRDRGNVIKGLREKGIDTRPIFFPISRFPMYEYANNVTADFIGARGLNLPSGVQRSEEDIDFICKEVLKYEDV